MKYDFLWTRAFSLKGSGPAVYAPRSTSRDLFHIKRPSLQILLKNQIIYLNQDYFLGLKRLSLSYLTSDVSGLSRRWMQGMKIPNKGGSVIKYQIEERPKLEGSDRSRVWMKAHHLSFFFYIKISEPRVCAKFFSINVVESWTWQGIDFGDFWLISQS